MQEKALNKGVQHFIKAPSDEIDMIKDIEVYKDVNEEPDTGSASAKKNKTTKVWCYVFHNEKKQDEAKA
jgi:hypothetical protein